MSDLLSALVPWLLAAVSGCSLVILALRCGAEPFAPGIEFGPLVRRLIERRPLEDEDYAGESSVVSRQLRRRLRRNEWALHNQLHLIVWLMCLMLVSRLLILASAMVGSCLSGSLEELFHSAISHWVRWDAAGYISLARHGYSFAPELLNYLPLYPLLVRGMAFLCFGHYVFAGFAVSNLALLGAGWALFRLVAAQHGERMARRAVIFLMFSPLSLFFSVPCAESLFLMLTLLAVLCARNRAFFPAALCGMLSAATHLAGVLVLIPVLVEALKYLHCLRLYQTNRARFARLLAALLLLCLMIPLGTLAYMLVNAAVAGSPVAFIGTLRDYWGQGFGSMLKTQRYSIDLAFNYGDIAWQLGTWIPQAVAIFSLALLLLVFSTVIDPADGLYAWLYMVLVLSPSWLLSGARQLASLYPLYLMLAVISRHKSLYLTLISLSIVLMCFFSYLYALPGTVV